MHGSIARVLAIVGAATMLAALPQAAAATNVNGLLITVPTSPVAIKGIVRTAVGTPIANALVVRYGANAGQVTTDSGGHYAFYDVPHDTYKLAVDPHAGAPDAKGGWYAAGQPNHFTSDFYAATRLRYTGTTLTADMKMPSGHTISGRITRAAGGDSLGGLYVQATTGRLFLPAYGFFTSTALTDASGRYVIRGLTDASYHLSVNARPHAHLNVLPGCYSTSAPHHYASKCGEANLAVQGANLTHRDMALPDGHRVHGKVRAPSGEPLCFKISFASTGEPGFARLDTARGCGSFSIDSVPSGTLSIDVLPGGSSRFLEIRKNAKVGNADVDLGTIWPNPGDTISGRVVTSHGDPVPNATVMLSNPMVAGGNTQTDADGRYSFTVEHRQWSVFVDPTNSGFFGPNSGANGRAGWYDAASANHWTADSHQATALAAGSHSGINLRLPPGYTISGRLRDPSGAPVAATVRVGSYDGGTYTSYTITDAQGNWTVTGLRPGHYEIQIAPDDSATKGYPKGFYSSTAPGHFTRGQSHETRVYVGP